jgi:drug/metabolite transporter (DMT)-like permease
MKKSRNLVPLAGVGVAVTWGLTFLSIKVSVAELTPMTLASLRFILASMILPLIALATKTSLKISFKDFPLIAVSGLIGITMYFFFENNGVMRLSASESSIIVGTIPVLTLIVEMLAYKARPKAAVVAGILMSFAGVGLIVARSEAAKSSPAGYLFMVGAALSWVLYTFITRKLGGKYPFLTVTFWQIFAGTLGCIPLGIAEGWVKGPISFPVVANVVFLGVLASAFGYWLYVIVLDKLGASRSSVFINLIPVVSIVAAFVLLGERLAPLQLAGGAVTIAGVYLATYK